MRVKLTLFPAKRKVVLPINYNYFLTSLIYKIIHNSSEDYSAFLHDEGYKLGESKKGFKLFTYSMLKSKKIKIDGEKIIFLNSHVEWQISSPLDNFIQHLVTGVFAEGQGIEIKPGLNSLSSLNVSSRFLIERVETLSKPEFKKTMRFTCLSPITVSKVTGSPTLEKGGEGGFYGKASKDSPRPLRERVSVRGNTEKPRCHYLRPWEDGFSEAIKNNLIKKCNLVHGKDIEDSDFKIKIDTDYMNKKSGKITKNINFKGTNIIGFMSPFEVSGNPELIEIGYEAGFGEKGSMGFGMVKETD
jgi:CRISPR-associated endoribonuclease Cas6